MKKPKFHGLISAALTFTTLTVSLSFADDKPVTAKPSAATSGSKLSEEEKKNLQKLMDDEDAAHAKAQAESEAQKKSVQTSPTAPASKTAEAMGPRLMTEDQKRAILHDIDLRAASEMQRYRAQVTAIKKARATHKLTGELKATVAKNNEAKEKSDKIIEGYKEKFGAVVESLSQLPERFSDIAVNKWLKNRMGSVWYFPASEAHLDFNQRHRILLVFDYNQAPDSTSTELGAKQRCGNAESTMWDASEKKYVPCKAHLRAWRFKPGETADWKLLSKETHGTPVVPSDRHLDGLTFREFVDTMGMLERSREARNAENEWFKKDILSPEGEVTLASIVSFAMVADLVRAISKSGSFKEWPNAAKNKDGSFNKSVVWDTPANEAYAKTCNVPWPPSGKELLKPLALDLVEGGGADFDIVAARAAAAAEKSTASRATGKLKKGVRTLLSPSIFGSEYVKRVVVGTHGVLKKIPQVGGIYEAAAGKVKWVANGLYKGTTGGSEIGSIIFLSIEGGIWYGATKGKIESMLAALHAASDGKVKNENQLVRLLQRAKCYAEITDERFISEGATICNPSEQSQNAQWGAQTYTPPSSSPNSDIDTGEVAQEEQDLELATPARKSWTLKSAYEATMISWALMKERLKKSTDPTLRREKSDRDFDALDRELQNIMNQYDASAELKKR